ncbi:carbohydrate esterase family 4 protein [Panaeolus papilionaceus]|nr:carbohydrate esterase family 4 protein [Panaeolus papilionaceus]
MTTSTHRYRDIKKALCVLGAFAVLGTNGMPDSNMPDASIPPPGEKACAGYYYAPVANAIASFPIIWQPATILPSDTNAQTKWNSIKQSIPDIEPRGTTDGNFNGVNYPADDPDCWWTATKCVTPKAQGIPADIAVMPEPRTLGYGFDDGPNCTHNRFYDYLKSQNQKATMFFIGSNVMNWPMEAQRAITDGHEVCVHTWSHRYLTAMESEDVFAELYYTLQAIKLVAGVTPTCFRPPFGDIDDRVRAIANALGLRTVLWKYDSDDWQFGTTPKITNQNIDSNYQNMINDAQKGLFDTVGTIILAHELNDFTMQEAINFYPKLKAAFSHIVPIAVGMNVTHPYVEGNTTFPTFEQYITGSMTLSTNLTVANNTVQSTSSVQPSPTHTQSEKNSGSSQRLDSNISLLFLALTAFAASSAL